MEDSWGHYILSLILKFIPFFPYKKKEKKIEVHCTEYSITHADFSGREQKILHTVKAVLKDWQRDPVDVGPMWQTALHLLLASVFKAEKSILRWLLKQNYL